MLCVVSPLVAFVTTPSPLPTVLPLLEPNNAIELSFWSWTSLAAALGILALVFSFLQLRTSRVTANKIYAQEESQQVAWLQTAVAQLQSATAALQSEGMSSRIQIIAEQSSRARLQALATDDTVITLKAYFKSNLAQVSTIFWVSVIASIAGFLILIASIPMPGTAKTPTIIGGIASQFIAATFLVVYRSAVAQAGTFSKTLERLRLANMLCAERAVSIKTGLELLDEMTATTDDLKSQTVAKAVLLLVGEQAPLNPDEKESESTS
jgi:hypothetical protein